MSIQIKLVSASLNKEGDFLSKNDPYVKFRLGNEEKRSKVKDEAGSNAVFNQTFSFTSQTNDLKVTVLDDDTFSDDVLGQGQINIAQYRTQPNPQNVEVVVTQNGQPSGRVYLVIQGQGGQWGGNQFGGQPNPWGNQPQPGGFGQQGGNTGNTQGVFFGAAQQLGQQGLGGQQWG